VKAGDSRPVTISNNTHLSVYYFLPPNFLNILFFSPENGCSKFLRNFVSTSYEYMASEESPLYGSAVRTSNVGKYNLVRTMSINFPKVQRLQSLG
jgi:hypothetical protein